MSEHNLPILEPMARKKPPQDPILSEEELRFVS